MGNLKMAIPKIMSKFSRDESGTGTVFSIFGIGMLIMIGGIAIDGSNFWRNEQMLQKTADVAAHAGVVALANGNDNTTARDNAASFVDYNMPFAQLGTFTPIRTPISKY